jgi:hypothetical protein
VTPTAASRCYTPAVCAVSVKASKARTITNAKVLPRFHRSAKPCNCGAPYQAWLIPPLTIAPANKWRTKLSRYCTFTSQKQRKLSSNISSFCLVSLCYNKNSVLMGVISQLRKRLATTNKQMPQFQGLCSLLIVWATHGCRFGDLLFSHRQRISPA